MFRHRPTEFALLASALMKIAARVAVGALALVSLVSMTASTQAQEEERPYPKMLLLSQYLMERNAAIALARSAAPEALDWASRSLKREFERVIMVEVLIEEMFRSD